MNSKKANIELSETEPCFFWTAMRLNELGSAFIIDSGKHWEAYIFFHKNV